MTLCLVVFVIGLNIYQSGIPKTFGDTGKTPFIKAIYLQDQSEFYRLVVDKKEFYSKTDSGWTPLMVATIKGNTDIFSFLLNNGASREGIVNYKSYKELDILRLAIVGKNPEFVRMIANDKNVTIILDGMTALHLASRLCSPEIIDILIEKGASPNIPSRDGFTPLHVATEKKCYPAVVSLIEGGANPHIKNEDGKTPIDLIDSDDPVSYYLDKKGRLPAGK